MRIQRRTIELQDEAIATELGMKPLLERVPARRVRSLDLENLPQPKPGATNVQSGRADQFLSHRSPCFDQFRQRHRGKKEPTRD